MCGIVGTLSFADSAPIEEATLRRMLGMIRHRGPDQFGIYLDHAVGLGSARLSIIDLEGGQQPIANEDESLWIVFNGEIFNYPELRTELETEGHRFRTKTDTEVFLHLFEKLGPACLERLNGQFAVAIWDRRAETLFLARDRLGVRPLFYARTGGALVFGSEIKAILADPRVSARIDPLALDDVFTFWSTLPGRERLSGNRGGAAGPLRRRGTGGAAAPFLVAAGLHARAAASGLGVRRGVPDLLVDATRIRLRADVPVGAYLSGGLDSATITAIARRLTSSRLETFSIAFTDSSFDESEHQAKMAKALGTNHHVLEASHAEIGRVFPEVDLAHRGAGPADRAGPHVPAVEARARPRLQGGPHGRRGGRASGRLRHLQGDEDSPLLGEAARFAMAPSAPQAALRRHRRSGQGERLVSLGVLRGRPRRTFRRPTIRIRSVGGTRLERSASSRPSFGTPWSEAGLPDPVWPIRPSSRAGIRSRERSSSR